MPERRIREIIVKAVDIEKEFVVDALPVELIGMNSRLMMCRTSNSAPTDCSER